MKPVRLFAVLLVFFLTPAVYAQLGLYGSFTASKLNAPASSNTLYGGTFGAYLASGHVALLSGGIDLRGSFARASGVSYDSGLIGPRAALNPHVLPLSPYVEAMIGIGHANFVGGLPGVTKFEYQFLGGVDFTIFPRLDWRVAEFSYGGLGGLNGSSFHPKSLSTGIVLRLPRFLPLP